MKATQDFDWKRVADRHYIYRVKTGKILGEASLDDAGDEGSIYRASLKDEGDLGQYVNLSYAKAALLEAASTAITRKTTKRV